MLFAVFTSLLIIGITITSFRAVQGSFWSQVFNWVVAGLLLALYLVVAGHFPIYRYVDELMITALTIALFGNLVRIPANVTGHSGDRDRFAHGHHAGVSFVL